MRIQHNIMAMNAYRNYSNNTSALSKNLEKLSSGYKINRAGDDAAGLAISEKMRAQITGLEAAQKNVKDGISLVNTAEGALQEVQNMMNRMVYLAQESANGTFDNEVDRKSLQDEVDQLRDEINRIADSANFNGIKLLDGSLGGSKSAVDGTLPTKSIGPTSSTSEAGVALAAIAANNTLELKYDITDKDGNVKESVTVTLTASSDQKKLTAADGTEYEFSAAATKGDVADVVIQELVKNSSIKDNFTVAETTANSAIIEFTSKATGDDALTIGKVQHNVIDSDGKVTETSNTMKVTAGVDEYEAVDLSKATVWDGDKKTLEDAIFEINGEKFVLISSSAAATAGDVTDDMRAWFAEAGIGNNYVINVTDGGATTTDAAAAVKVINAATGLTTKHGTVTTEKGINKFDAATADVFISLQGAAAKQATSKGGLTLQIGDSSDSYNQLRVQVKDMHTKAMGIDSIDISTQAGAQAAVDVIKQAINYVSSVRGTLGALSNRLDHTQNNLSVMRENIQDAESAIRDTDVADEMMAYTKNNILVQSAQAMLAQANQVPQGVLQLLQ